ncbi:MAG TPA: hypothetical protein VFB66_31745, partial [Tepidisphaeraceae bacterium]|nr:hypothetical protein [Tepidisphaeraceae bacterium]
MSAPSDAPRAFFDERVETLDPEALRAHQWARLQALVREVLPANAFVTARWRSAGLAEPADLRGWDDFARLPFASKSELVDDQVGRPPFGSNLTYPMDRYVRVHQTSG